MAGTPIVFNGEPKIVESTTILELMKEFNLEGKRVAVELNRSIVPRGSFSETQLSQGDAVEIVHFVGGG